MLAAVLLVAVVLVAQPVLPAVLLAPHLPAVAALAVLVAGGIHWGPTDSLS